MTDVDEHYKTEKFRDGNIPILSHSRKPIAMFLKIYIFILMTIHLGAWKFLQVAHLYDRSLHSYHSRSTLSLDEQTVISVLTCTNYFVLEYIWSISVVPASYVVLHSLLLL